MTENKNTNQQPSGTTNSNDKKNPKSGLKALFESIWSSLDPQKKKYVVTFVVGLAFIVLAIAMYSAKKGTAPTDNNVAKQGEIKSLFVGKEEKDDKLSLAYSFEERIKRLEEQKKQEEEINKKLYPIQDNNTMNTTQQLPYPKPPIEEPQSKPVQHKTLSKTSDNKVYSEQSNYSTPPPNVPINKPAPIIEYKTVGGIEVVSFNNKDGVAGQEGKNQQEKRERSKKINYLPTSTILQTTLITGVYAPTMAKGMQNPYPVVMRLKDLSFLPNSFQKDLSGCFLSGEAYGSLAEERAMIRLLKLSCLSIDGKKVIDKAVKGYVVGEDGMVGISGHVVSKQGKALAMAFVSSFLQGVGQGLATANTMTNITPTGGTITDVKPENLLKYGAGTGFSESFKMLAEFYMSIVKETAPVIEIKGNRNIDAILTEGLELSIEDYVWEGIKDE